jgi:hypothetical protein
MAEMAKLKPVYDTFKRINYIPASDLQEIKRVARLLGMAVSDSCQSCAPDLLIKIMRHHYLPNVK